MRGLSIKTKLITLVISSLLLLSVIILSVSVYESVIHSKEDKLEQLSSITAAKKQHIENYFNSIKGLIVSTANSASTANSFKYFNRFFKQLDSETAMDTKNIDIQAELIKHYEANYLNDINFNLSNVTAKRATMEYLPKDINGQVAQYIYIVKNEARVGEKNSMSESSSLTSSYTLNHTKYHETFNTMLQAFNLYDIFLVDKKGTVVYSVFKEKDFGTNLNSGPYANSGIASAHKQAMQLEKGQVAFVDFKPYEPSLNAPASFIATPVFNNRGKRLGNLIMQFPVNVIDDIMNFNGKFKEAGLGESGNSYLVASDHTMRSDYRFIKEVDNADVKSANTTIGFYNVKSESSINALAGKSGYHQITNFRDEEVLSAYSEVEVFDKHWAIVSEMSLEEALASTISLNLILAAISLVILLLISLISVVALRNLVIQPLKKFEEGLLGFFDYLNLESTKVEPLDDTRRDEIGNMSKVVNKNIVQIKEAMDKDRELINETVQVLSEFEQGDLCQRISKNSNNPALNELKDVLNKMGTNLEYNIDNILNILEQYTHYNYLDKVDSKGLKEHLLKLANGVNSLGDSISQMLVENKTNGMKLDQSSDVLLDSVHILSNNTNEAAASIEQTSAALEQINSNVETNNHNVDKMSSYAKELSTSVVSGEQLANQTTVAMDEINEQVSSINEAITVIDKIAFQTNILSLNAAVEAATAGEAGKGFAVVAQEVRNLAGRSSEAAKEIKALVETANMKANEGKVIADSMIDGYSHLSTNINSTIELIESVSTASKEQQQGIVQVSEAVSQLDRQTQENAAIAQNTHSIAEDTDRISKRVVSNANKKEFHGKNDIKIEKTKEKKALKKTLKAFGNDSYKELKAKRKEAQLAYHDIPVKKEKKEKPLKFNGIKPKVRDAHINTTTPYPEQDEWESF